MRVQVDPLGYASQVIQACKISSFVFLAMKYFLTDTTAVPNLDISIHVDKFLVIKNAFSRKYRRVMPLQVRELRGCECTMTFP